MQKYEAVYFFSVNRLEHTLDQVTPKSLRGDAEVVLSACEYGKGLTANLMHASQALLDDSAFALKLAAISNEGRALQYLSARLRDDKDVVMAFVSAYRAGTNLEFASERLRADEDVLRAALGTDGMALAFVPAQRQGDRALIALAFHKHGCALGLVPEAMLQDREFVLDFVIEHRAHDGVLGVLPARYAQDRELVMQILAHDAQSLQFVADDLREDPELVLQAMFNSDLNPLPAMGFEFAGPSLRQDKAFVAKALERLKPYRTDYRKTTTTAIKDVHKLAVAASKGPGAAEVTTLKASLRDVRKALQGFGVSRYETEQQSAKLQALQERLAACSGNAVLMTAWVEADYLRDPMYANDRGQCTKFIALSLMKDRKFLAGLMTVSRGGVLDKLDPAFGADADFVLANVGYLTPPAAIAPALRRDADFLVSLITRAEFLSQVKDITDPLMWQERSFVLRMVAVRGSLLELADPALKADTEVVTTAFAQNPNSLRHAAESVFNDRGFMQAALKADADDAALKLPEPMLSDIDFLLDCLQAIENSRSPAARTLMSRVPRKVRSDKRFLSLCLSRNGWGIEHVPQALQYDKDVLTAAFSAGFPIWKSLDLEKLRSTFSRAEIEAIVGTPDNIAAIFRD